MEPAYAYNELKVMAEMDDVQGDGIFDPPGAQKNIHPDAGVFATNYDLPGMHARERPFSFSEERDITTGRPIRAVPSGAVANDSSAQIAFLEQGLYPRPKPMIGLIKNMVPDTSTVNVMQHAIPISGLGVEDPTLIATGPGYEEEIDVLAPVPEKGIGTAGGILVGAAIAYFLLRKK